MARPSNSVTVVKKRTKKFKRFQADRFMRLGNSWRKPHGIDGVFRKKADGNHKHPSQGFQSNKRTKFLLPNGFYKFRVSNPADLDMLLMHNSVYAAEIRHNVSGKKRKAIIERAKQLDVRVINAASKLKRTDAN